MIDKYELVIGLEIHLQLNTRSKAFCGDAVAFGSAANNHVSAISLGHPGTLPRLNKEQLKKAVKLGIALGSTISLVSKFDRKNYFYADLPKGYQITQDKVPICVGGGIEIKTAAGPRYIRFHHIHMEEDAGKLIHDMDDHFSFIDLNRAGTPLLEMVTEPDLRTAEEVAALMSSIRQLARYLEISDGNMEEGSMRCDCNISVKLRTADELGERCEVKNVNSMKFAKQAIEYEFKRQVEIIENGGKIERNTLNFDPNTGITTPLRSKEDANDYRYFPEPDLCPVRISKEEIEEIKALMPRLPKDLFDEFTAEFGLSQQEAEILTEEKEMGLYFRNLCLTAPNKKSLTNLVINKIRPYLIENNLTLDNLSAKNHQILAFLKLIEDGIVSSAIAYQRIFPYIMENNSKMPLQIAQELNLIQSSDTDFIENICKEVILAFPDKVKYYQKGKKGLIGFFMGEVMKRSKGQAEPKSTTEILNRMLLQ
ncbi:MAG: Asp-tRNA(Asn)/Glu-tRNA(Gln) amidotransferase subunit GatB [Saprospiraceae bacterium]